MIAGPMEIQKLLRSDGFNYKLLEQDPYYLKITEHPDGRVLFNYDQTESPRFNHIVEEARGLILDKNNNWSVVARSFDRFYNYGENPNQLPISVEDSIIQEKIDGTLITLYFYQNRWRVSTTGKIDAEGRVGDYNFTFKDLFLRVFDLNKLYTRFINLSYCFVFELVSPESRIITMYEKPELYLLTIVDKSRGVEYIDQNYLAKTAKELGVKTPKLYTFKSIGDLVSQSKSLHVLDEGFVLLSYTYNITKRIKFKNPSWVAIANIKNTGAGMSDYAIMSLILSNEHHEYLSYFPEDKPKFDPYINSYARLKKCVEDKWEEVKHIENQKELAITLRDFSERYFVFEFKKGKTFEHSMKNLLDKTKFDLLKKYKEEFQ